MSTALRTDIALRASSDFMNEFAVVSAPKRGLRGAPQPTRELPFRFWDDPRSTTGNTEAERSAQTDALYYGLFQIIALAAAAYTGDSHLTEEVKISRWATWVGTLSRLVFGDNCADSRLASSYSPLVGEPLRRLTTYTEHMAAAGVAATRLRAAGGNPAAAYEAVERQLMADYTSVTTSLGFPASQEEVGADAFCQIAACQSSREVAAYFALVAYLAGKKITVENQEGFTDRRTANLEAKFNNKQRWPTISGDYQLSDEAQYAINDLWEVDPTFRLAFFRPLIMLEGGSSGVAGNIVFTMVKMLRWSNMAHVKIIHDFLAKYPWAPEQLPELTGSISFLREGMRKLQAVPSHEQLYVKLLHRDATDVFDRSQLLRIIGLAKYALGKEDPEVTKYAGTYDAALNKKFDSILLSGTDQAAVDGPQSGPAPREAGMVAPPGVASGPDPAPVDPLASGAPQSAPAPARPTSPVPPLDSDEEVEVFEYPVAQPEVDLFQ